MAIRLGICTPLESNIRALLTELDSIADLQIKCIRLPYNDLDRFRMTPGDVDGIILCHSIFDRRFAITDVTDALYNEFLRHAEDVVGKENISVIAHDFKWPMGEEMEDHGETKKGMMQGFMNQQPTTFQRSALALVCVRLDTSLQMDPEDVGKLRQFVSQVRPVVSKISTARSSRLDHSGNMADHDGNRAIIPSFLQLAIIPLVFVLMFMQWIIEVIRGKQ